jgi:hypothetical protein
MNDIATIAHDAGRLIAFALRPKQTPWTVREYAELLRRYEENSTFQTIVDGVIEGMGLRIVDVSRNGFFLAANEGSAFRLTVDDYKANMSAQDRILHGVIQVAIAAFSFPKAEVLDQEDNVAPAQVTPGALAEYIRKFAETEAARFPSDTVEETEERRVWREALSRALTMETSSGKESTRSLTGMCRQALDFLERQGLMRTVSEEKGIFQGTTALRIRLKYHGAHELLMLMLNTAKGASA